MNKGKAAGAQPRLMGWVLRALVILIAARRGSVRRESSIELGIPELQEALRQHRTSSQLNYLALTIVAVGWFGLLQFAANWPSAIAYFRAIANFPVLSGNLPPSGAASSIRWDWTAGIGDQVGAGLLAGSVALVAAMAIAGATPAPPIEGSDAVSEVGWSHWLDMLGGMASLGSTFGLAVAATQFFNGLALGVVQAAFAAMAMAVATALVRHPNDRLTNARLRVQLEDSESRSKRIQDRFPRVEGWSRLRSITSLAALIATPALLAPALYILVGMVVAWPGIDTVRHYQRLIAEAYIQWFSVLSMMDVIWLIFMGAWWSSWSAGRRKTTRLLGVCAVAAYMLAIVGAVYLLRDVNTPPWSVARYVLGITWLFMLLTPHVRALRGRRASALVFSAYFWRDAQRTSRRLRGRLKLAPSNGAPRQSSR